MNLHGEFIAFTKTPAVMNPDRLARRFQIWYRKMLGWNPNRFVHLPLPWRYWRMNYRSCVIDHMNMKPSFRDKERAWTVQWQVLSDSERQGYESFQQYCQVMNESGKVGDTYNYPEDRGKMCPSSFHILYPWILVMQSGGSFSFFEDGHSVTLGCADYEHQVVYRITRIEVD